MASNCEQHTVPRSCRGCQYARIMEATRPVGYAVVCNHPDFVRMQGRRMVRREVFGSRDEAEPPTRRPGFCPKCGAKLF